MAKITKARRRRPSFGREWNQFQPVVRAMVEGHLLDQIARVIAEQTARVLPVTAVGLWRVDRSRGDLCLVAQRGFGEPAAAELGHLPLTAAFAVDQAPLYHVAEQEGWGSVLALPLVVGDRVIGSLACVKETRQPYRQSERELIEALGDFWAIAIVRAAEVEVATEELRAVNQQLTISNLRAQELSEDAEAARDRATNLYDQLRQSLWIREEFMAAAAHELRSPITVIKGRTQLLLRNDTLEPKVRPSLESILRHADRLARLVDDLLAAIRLRPGGTELLRERFDLDALVRERVGLIARTTEHHRFDVDLTGPLVVDANRELIGELLSRFLENALRYSREGGTIAIVARPNADNAVVSVTDHGVGISRERQPHVFEPLFESVPPGEPGYEGVVSLGLHLSKEIVERSGGRIWFTSVAGEGSTFSFSLPLVSK